MLLWNTIEFAHMTLGLIPKILNSVNVVLLVCKQFGMVDAEVLKIRYIQDDLAAPTIGIDDAVWHHFALNNRI